MKYLWPIVFSIPALLTLGTVFYRLFAGMGIPIEPALLGASFFAFTASVAISFVVPDSKVWRAVAVLNVIPFIAIVLTAIRMGD